jgi:hypothetical protein
MTVDCVGVDEGHVARADRLFEAEIASNARTRAAAAMQNDDDGTPSELQPLPFDQDRGSSQASRIDRDMGSGRCGALAEAGGCETYQAAEKPAKGGASKKVALPRRD